MRQPTTPRGSVLQGSSGCHSQPTRRRRAGASGLGAWLHGPPPALTATTLFFLPLTSRPTAMPNAAEMEVELWPAPKGS